MAATVQVTKAQKGASKRALGWLTSNMGKLGVSDMSDLQRNPSALLSLASRLADDAETVKIAEWLRSDLIPYILGEK